MTRGKTLFASALTIVSVLVPSVAHAAVAPNALTMTLAPAVGPATTATKITAAGFAANEAVDVYGGSTDIALTVSDGTGAVSAAVTIPATAPPGSYWLTLIGRRSGIAEQKAFSVHADVAQSGADAGHRSVNRYENELNATTADQVDVNWKVQDADASPVAVVHGIAYLRNGSSIVALDEVSGTVKWTATLPCSAVGTPAVATYVFEGCTDGSVVALNLAGGTVKWHQAQPVSSTMSLSLQFANGTVYGATVQGRVFAFTSSGTPVWSNTQFPVQSLAVYGGLLYASTVGGTGPQFSVVGIDATTGVTLWTDSLGSGGLIFLYVVAGPEGAFAVFNNGAIYQLDGSGGEDNVNFTDVAYTGVPTLAGRRLFMQTSNGLVIAYSTGNLVELWRSTVAETVTPFVAGPLTWVGGQAFLSSDGEQVTDLNVYAVGQTVVTDGEVFTLGYRRVVAFGLPVVPAARPDPAALS